MNINLKTISPKIPFLKKYQREILIGFCAFLALLVRSFFPAKLDGEFFWLNVFLFLFFPWMIIYFLLRENFESFGICWEKNYIKGILLSLIFVLTFNLINYFVVYTPSLQTYLQISPEIVKNFWIFLWFQLVISPISHFSWEFFFRGFIQMGLEKKIGKYAIILQALAQTWLYVRSPWLIILLIGSSSLIAGIIANQSRSIYYSFISMWIISASLDIMIISYIRYGTI